MSIAILDDAAINQIAAGEVVENPASVVKELVENAVDAGATHITIEIEEGGFQRICIHDNGKGMNETDTHLALQRHATSKIRGVEDLDRLSSMGFRGEALPSIAAVSKMKLTSCDGVNMGVEIWVEGGKVQQTRACARTKGTTVEVNQLFYNVPARRKFQKSPAQALTEIHAQVLKLSLVHANVGLELICDGKKKLATHCDERKERIVDLLGADFVDGAYWIEDAVNGIEVWGCIGSPSVAKTTRRAQYVFINQRPVSSPLIANAVAEGYGTRLDTKRHPTFALFIRMPAHALDVNVHPQKREVRFEKPNEVMESITNMIQKALVPNIQPTKTLVSTPWSPPVEEMEISLIAEEPSQAEIVIAPIPIFGIYAHYAFLDARDAPLTSHLKERDGFVMVDLCRAEERIYYEMMQDEMPIVMQTLALPITLDFSSDMAERIKAKQSDLKQIGIGLRDFGDASFIIDSLAPQIDENQVADLIEHIVIEGKSPDQVAASFVRRKKCYQQHEASAILSELIKCRDPGVSPCGQPIFLHWDAQDVKRLFKKN